MIKRCLALTLVTLAVAGSFPAQAQDDGKDRLRRLLEKKFGNQTRPATPSPRSQELYAIDKEGKVRRVKPKKKTGNQSSTTLGTEPFTHAGAGITPTFATAGIWRRSTAPTPRGSGSSGGLWSKFKRLAQKAGQILVNRRTVVIQLKPGTNETQIDALVAKYNLKVIDFISSLGTLYVELPEDAGGPTTHSDMAKGRGTISSLLEPRIVLDLRKEPAVNAAFVQTTIAPKSLPTSTQVSVQHGNKTIRWHWRTDAADDGNWGLKAMRLPPAWTILRRAREKRGFVQPVTVAVLDTGFGLHPQLTYTTIKGEIPPQPLPPNCGTSHGTHVAGIIAAKSNTGVGTDGIMPNVRLDIIPISKKLMRLGAADGRDGTQQQMSYFSDAIRSLGEYLFEHAELAPKERRVINVSLGYNWGNWHRKLKVDPTTDQSIRNQIEQHANFLQFLVNQVSDQVLFVTAAGNDSTTSEGPFSAELATPFAFAALHKSPFFKPSKNIIVVEAHNRAYERAPFSNVGGHVAAPGVEVMSTLASDRQPNTYGVCDGTSQAAPHVSALAAMLFELDPHQKPADVIGIIRSSAIPETQSDSAPRADALAAISELSRDYLRDLADLNSDGRVDRYDLAIFKERLIAIENGRFGAPINSDLNGDDAINADERCWPRIDLNGSGRASYDPSDKLPLAGEKRSDLDVIAVTWTDKLQPFDTAYGESRLSELFSVWRGTSIVAAAPVSSPKIPCQ